MDLIFRLILLEYKYKYQKNQHHLFFGRILLAVMIQSRLLGGDIIFT